MRYYNPTVTQAQSTYVPIELPWDAIAKAGAQKQEMQDKLTAELAGAAPNVATLSGDKEDYLRKKAEIDAKVKSIYDIGDLASNKGQVIKAINDVRKEYSPQGTLGTMAANKKAYDDYMENQLKAMKENHWSEDNIRKFVYQQEDKFRTLNQDRPDKFNQFRGAGLVNYVDEDKVITDALAFVETDSSAWLEGLTAKEQAAVQQDGLTRAYKEGKLEKRTQNKINSALIPILNSNENLLQSVQQVGEFSGIADKEGKLINQRGFFDKDGKPNLNTILGQKLAGYSTGYATKKYTQEVSVNDLPEWKAKLVLAQDTKNNFFTRELEVQADGIENPTLKKLKDAGMYKDGVVDAIPGVTKWEKVADTFMGLAGLVAGYASVPGDVAMVTNSINRLKDSSVSLKEKEASFHKIVGDLRQQFPQLNTWDKNETLQNSLKTGQKLKGAKSLESDSRFLIKLTSVLENQKAQALSGVGTLNTKVQNQYQQTYVGKGGSGIIANSKLSMPGVNTNTDEVLTELGYSASDLSNGTATAFEKAEFTGWAGFDPSKTYQGGVTFNIPTKDGKQVKAVSMEGNKETRDVFQFSNIAAKAIRENKPQSVDLGNGMQLRFTPEIIGDNYVTTISEYNSAGQKIGTPTLPGADGKEVPINSHLDIYNYEMNNMLRKVASEAAFDQPKKD